MNERPRGGGRFDTAPPIPRYPLPPSTVEVVRQIPVEERHFGLLIDKFIHWEEPWRWDERRKREFLAVALQAVQSARDLQSALLERHLRLIKSYRDKGCHTVTLTARTAWRLLVSKARGSILETSLALDHLSGIPIIPATVVRGATRFYAQKVAELDQKTMERLFGTTDEVANVIFFDAIPEQLPHVELDVLHTHFQEYYFGQVPPARYLSTALGFFLTVASNTPFCFALASTEKKLLTQATASLKGALNDLGLGAKTAVGYGYFLIESKRKGTRSEEAEERGN